MAKRDQWNKLPVTELSTEDSFAILKVLTKSTLWMPRAFVRYVQQCNLEQREPLLAAHPARETHQNELEMYFAPHLAVGLPFIRRLVASERTRSWLHRYSPSARVVLDDNRIPKNIWSYAWCGRRYSEAKNGAWKSHGFRRYEASHILPHKREMHEPLFDAVFEQTITFNPSLLFVSTWNNLLVDKRVAGLTDNSPVVTAVLLHEVERRYGIDLSPLGRRRRVVDGVDVTSTAAQLAWVEEPADFRVLWDQFSSDRLKWLKKRLSDPKYRVVGDVPAETRP